jgi:exonuclease VII small subunit
VNVLAITQAEFVAWSCFVIGIGLLGGGVIIGLGTSLRRGRAEADDAQTKLGDAQSKLDDARAQLDKARGHIQNTASAVAETALESVDVSTSKATESVEAAEASAEAAQTALQQVQGIVAALPENLRFAGLLILVGTVLVGVATVQFGGISLF